MDTSASVGKDLPASCLTVEVDFYQWDSKITSFHELSPAVLLLFKHNFPGSLQCLGGCLFQLQYDVQVLSIFSGTARTPPLERQ